MKLQGKILLKGLLINFSLMIIASASLLAQSASSYKIPFILTAQNNILIKATLNGKDTVSLMFHTAASSLTLTHEAIEKMKSLQFEGTDTVKSWGGAENSSRYSKSNTLQIGGNKWYNIPLWENLNSGPGSGGKFGLELFEGKVIDINFDQKIITISKSLPKRIKDYESLNLIYKNEMMFIEAQCKIGEELFSNNFLIHSGYAGSILFDDGFTESHHLDEKLVVTSEKTLKDSFGNVLKTKKAAIPFLSIGETKLNDVSVGFFQGALGRQKMSIIGGDLLKRFNIVIAADRKTIFLKPNGLKDAPHSNV
ncbi:aspartyl protease family protein [Pedobacter mucosus]|uniref:aspartyl protease family protein n=1 Tax=Pedobacter mucosus TaxID=2895286 RepID=UPI001EE467BC|nr:aspartyl protease family protein [Pedobacter mucosus]UKT62294.1 aspartyl protease family protein [Pedobacter mucosus]